MMASLYPYQQEPEPFQQSLEIAKPNGPFAVEHFRQDWVHASRS
jgi:hypothetical protein